MFILFLATAELPILSIPAEKALDRGESMWGDRHEHPAAFFLSEYQMRFLNFEKVAVPSAVSCSCI